MIPVYEPWIGAREKELVARCMETGWISSEGSYIREFEEGFAAFTGRKHGVAVCNGTAALETALYAADLGAGEILMPAFTIISCAVAAVRVGLKPVLVDIEPETWNMDVARIEERIGPATRAIMPAHIYGHPVDMDPLMEIAGRRGLTVVEDASEAHGASYKGRRLGTYGQVSTFSFYANKVITTGEGGMVLTDEEHVAARARSFRNLCFDAERRFHHEDLGNNYRMTNLQAAIGVGQLERIDEMIARKRAVAATYRRRLADVPGVRLQAEQSWARSIWWMVAVELTDPRGPNADLVMERLKRDEIGARHFFKGLHRQPALTKLGFFQGEAYPHTDRAYEYGFYLPSSPKLTEEQIAFVCDRLRKAIV